MIINAVKAGGARLGERFAAGWDEAQLGGAQLGGGAHGDGP